MSKFNYLYEDPSTADQVIGNTPHGIYDSDTTFQNESIQIVKYVARKLGHPVMQLELNSGSIYACYEEAVSDYSVYINNYNTKNWMWDFYGNESNI